MTPPTKVARLAGHTLRDEGRVYVQGVHRTHRGVGRCSCGDTSEVLDSDNARKRWHRAHKLEKATAGR